MQFKDITKEMLPALETTLKEFVYQNVPDDYSGLRDMMTYHLGWTNQGNVQLIQGKRIRPLLVLLSTALFNQNWKIALPAAAAVELLHNFSLIHDDIQDNSDLRRGRETVWRIWGVPQAINAGDTMFTLSQICLLNLNRYVTSKITVEAMQVFNKTCIDLTGGQYLDMDFENRENVSSDLYFKMISGKTASLLSACTELGAVVADTNQHNREKLLLFGKSLGLAFQIWDDWLGIWGDEAETGKSISSDLVNGKKTMPILYALDQKKEFYQFVNQNGKDIDEFAVRKMINCLEKDGAKDFTERLAKEYTDQALQSIDSLTNVDLEIKNIFLELTNHLLERNN